MDGPTNANGSRGVIDYSGRLLINDNVRFALALGYCYRFEHRFAAVAAGTSVRMLFDPSLNGSVSGNVYKLKGQFITTKNPIVVKFYEQPTVSANGSEITIFNFNRIDGDPSLNSRAKMYYGPTVDDSGNAYGPDVYIYADTSVPGLSLSVPGDTADEFSVYVDSSKKYMWELQNQTGEATDIIFLGRAIYEPDYRTGGR